jgi:hypothetical protein
MVDPFSSLPPNPLPVNGLTAILTSPFAYLKTPKSPSLDALWLPTLFILHRLKSAVSTWDENMWVLVLDLCQLVWK